MGKDLCSEKVSENEVLNLLKCNICWEIFSEPTILPCGHTFCLKCLREMGRHRLKNTKITPNRAQDVSIYCPNCRHSVHMDDVSCLKNGVRLNYALSTIKEALQKSNITKKVDASTNTETDAVIDEKIQKIESNVNKIFHTIKKKGSVLHDAYCAVERIRDEHINETESTASRSCDNGCIKNSHCLQLTEGKNDKIHSHLNVYQPEFIPRIYMKQTVIPKHPNAYKNLPQQVPFFSPLPLSGLQNQHGNPTTFDPAILSVGHPLIRERNA